MISKLSILAIAALYFLAPGIKGEEECVPTQVMFVSITSDAVLYWKVHPKEPCQIDEFIVHIKGDADDEFHMTVREDMLDVSFLKICEEWTFVVTPVSDGVVGYERRLVDHIPLPHGTELTIASFSGIHSGPRMMWLTWELANHTIKDCVLQYRIVMEDQQTGDVKDLYVSGNFTQLRDLSPCVSYEFSIRAISRALPTEEGPARVFPYDMPPLAETVPTVNNIVVGATTVDLRFNLEKFDKNRCPVRTLFVDGGNIFNFSIPLENSEYERPPVEVNLKGLKPDRMYFLRVSVENAGGISPPAQVAVQTLPLDPGRQ